MQGKKARFFSKRRSLFTGVALTLTLALNGVGAAWAGPDNGKSVLTTTHVDAPHVFWEDNNFVLRSHVGAEGPYQKIEDTVVWIGKGWLSSGYSAYTINVLPGNGMKFLGTPGTVLYRAPSVPDMGRQEPIWLGFGADNNIPTEKFRGAQFTTDFIGLDGPGRIEMFNISDTESVNRLFSSHEAKYRSAFMSKGTHTHNETTFTKPGRYTATYRVSARLLDGSLVQSAPQTLVYQVGGANPATAQIGDYQQAFLAAKDSEVGAGIPSVTIKPLTNIQRDGDQYQSTLEFSTGNPADSGHVIWTIDGFYLTEVPVVNGVASWNEMLGDQVSQLQAIYIPNSGPTGKWISQVLPYQRFGTDTIPAQDGSKPTTTVLSSNQNGVTFNPPQSTDPIQTFPNHSANLAGKTVAVETYESARTSTEGHMTDFRLTAPEDFYGVITGGIYEGDSKYPDCQLTFAMGGEKTYVATEDVNYCDSAGEWMSTPTELRLTFYPHPELRGEAAQITIPNFTVGKTLLASGTFLPEASAPLPSAPSQPETDTVPAPPVKPGECSVEQPCVFSKGHLDLFYLRAPIVDGNTTLSLDLKEDITGSGIIHAPEAVVLQVDKIAKTEKTKAFPQIGKSLYLLPQTQNPALLWPGWETLAIRKSGLNASKFHIDSISAPEGGQIYAFVNYSFLETSFKAVTEDSKRLNLEAGDVIPVPYASHAHLNWGFTKPGTYTMKVHASAKLADGKELVSRSVTYTWRVAPEHLESENNTNSQPEPVPSSTPGNTTEASENHSAGSPSVIPSLVSPPTSTVTGAKEASAATSHTRPPLVTDTNPLSLSSTGVSSENPVNEHKNASSAKTTATARLARTGASVFYLSAFSLGIAALGILLLGRGIHRIPRFQ